MKLSLVESAEHKIVEFLEATTAHYMVHPDTNVCGGIGGCGLLRHEHQTAETVREVFEVLAAENEDFTLNIVRR